MIMFSGVCGVCAEEQEAAAAAAAESGEIIDTSKPSRLFIGRKTLIEVYTQRGFDFFLDFSFNITKPYKEIKHLFFFFNKLLIITNHDYLVADPNTG